MTLEHDLVMRVNGLRKKFCRSLRRSMYYGSVDAARAMAGLSVNGHVLRRGEFWALDDVSFSLKRGEGLGLIGQNGSGKTTLLRVINGVFPPDVGSVAIRGRMGALIAVGAGFHPHMTGRENVFLNGTLLGMKRGEIERKLDDILDFADIGEFVDAPVATYSSGMTVRLGFAIAVHTSPDILVADEVLAVGDLAFALKCYRKISHYREQGGSILLVSHSIQLIRNTCQRVLWLHDGRVRGYGDSQSVCDEYEQFMLAKSAVDRTDFAGAVINNDPRTRITAVAFIDATGTPREEHRVGDRFVTRIHFEFNRRVERPVVTVSFTDPENIQVVSNYSMFDGVVIDSLEGKGYVDFVIDRLPLKPSEYRCTVTLTENESVNNILEWHDKAHRFRVVSSGATSYGLINPFPRWEITHLPSNAKHDMQRSSTIDSVA